MKRTPLYDYHLQHGKMIEFAGYDMPVWYTSITDEHLAVRNKVGVFDVSHMGRVTVAGSQVDEFIEALIPTKGSSQPAGRSFYTLMLNPGGGIVDDLIVIKGEASYLLVVNASNKTKDLEQMKSLSSRYDVEVEDVTDMTTMIAVQGPDAVRALQPLAKMNLAEIKRFTHATSEIGGSRATITRTGYTGEDGFEIILHDSGIQNNQVASWVWNDLAARVTPCGLGARDSLRIESGLPLYGYDIDETTNPVEAELSWVVSKEKSGYVGDESMARYLSTIPHRLRRGLILQERIPRHGFEVTNEKRERVGTVTSGTYSPILKKGIAIAYIDFPYARLGQSVKVLVRDDSTDGQVVKPPFYDERVYGWRRTIQQTI